MIMDISLARRVNQVQFYFMFKKLQNKAFCSFFRDIAMFHIRLETANTNKFGKIDDSLGKNEESF